jgi:hypothetical protein
MRKTTERFFIATPIPSLEIKTDSDNNTFPVYLNEKGKPMMWSGAFPVPAIGSRVFIKMNNIGWAVVKGYFESCGYVGVMTLPVNPPAWLREQLNEPKGPNCPDWVREGVGREFRSELTLQEPHDSPDGLNQIDSLNKSDHLKERDRNKMLLRRRAKLHGKLKR